MHIHCLYRYREHLIHVLYLEVDFVNRMSRAG